MSPPFFFVTAVTRTCSPIPSEFTTAVVAGVFLSWVRGPNLKENYKIEFLEPQLI